MKVLCIGSSLLEITCQINEPIKENAYTKITDKTECGAGHAGNIAYLLGKWGVEAYIASMMGADDAGNKIKKEYEAIGVKTEFIETSYDKSTSESISLVNKTNKNKTIIEISSNAFLKRFAYGIEPDIIVSDGTDYNASVAAFDKFTNKISLLAVSSVSQEVIELCKYVNYIIFNRSSAEAISGLKIDYNDGSTLVNLYNKLKQRFNKEIIVTLGERGSLYALNGAVKIMPTMVSEVQDTNGAGDVFAGTIVYAMGRNFDLEKAITYATIAASLSTTKLTSRNSIPTLNEVTTIYDQKFGQASTNNANINVNNNQASPEVNNVQNPNPQESQAVNMQTNVVDSSPNAVNMAVDNNDNK